jgi:hypothetical protein
MARSLFVPVHLHARLVTATTASLPGLGAPFTEPTAGLPPGVHLHWALPDALTRAQVDPLAQTLRFPAVPDRWLVVRFADAPTFATGGLRPPPRACKAFVVDAKNRKSGPLGAVAFTPVAEWLTVMGLLPDGVKTGQGGPLPRDIHLEAAYYPLARDRFGFHDDLADLGAVDWSALRLSYLVVGSYTRSSEDPLARLADDDARLEWIDDARLEVDLPRPRHVHTIPVHHDPLASVRRIDPGLVSVLFAGDKKKQVSHPLERIGELDLRASATTSGRLEALRGEIEASHALAAAIPGLKVVARPLLPAPEDNKGVPSRLVCHGALVDLGDSGAYTGLGVLPDNPSCRVADSASAAIEEAFAGIGSGDVFAVLRGGLDGEIGDTTGMQALPYLLHAAGFDGAPDEAPTTTELVATIRDTGPTLGLPNLDPNAPVRVVDRRTVTGPSAPAAVAVKALGTLPGAVTLEARRVPAPRWHRAGTPVVQIERAGRSFRHGHDGRMQPDGRLRCRAGGQLVTEVRLDVLNGSPPGAAITGDRLVALDPALRFEPAFVRDLIHELAVLDPSSRAVAAGVWLGAIDPAYHALPLAEIVSAQVRALVEGWWAAADPSAGKPDAAAHFVGSLPAPLAITPWHAPWLPLFAEIDYRFTPNTNDSGAGLVLEPHEPRFTPPTEGPALVITAREVLSSAPADTLQSAIARVQAHFGKDPARKAQLAELVARLASLDLQTVALGDLDPQLRDAGHAFRGGTLVVQRLRLVDTFGQTLQPPTPKRALPPRLTTWARVQARLAAAQGDGEADPLRSPLCGCFVFDAVEQALEVFSPAGAALGQLRHDRDNPVANTTVWEPAPAREGVAADALPTPLRDVVAALRAPAPNGTGESALIAALKVMDGARFTVARRQTGDDYRGMLLRRPVLLLRVHLTLEVAGVGLGDGPDRGQPVKAPGAIKVRLGCAEQLDDGLLGFLARDQGSAWRLHVVPAVAQGAWTSPQQNVHPIVDRNIALTLVPGVPVEVLLLLDGASSFHVQAGLLPRKRIDVQEVVSSRLLGQLRATLRVGPVLFDPGQRRVPAPELPGERWTLVERSGDDFSEGPLAPFSPALSELPERPVTLRQGWIRLDTDG